MRRLALVTLLVAGCSFAVAPLEKGGGPTLRYAPAPSGTAVDFAALPWPSDLYRDDVGAIAVGALPVGPMAQADPVNGLRAALSRLHGFGVTTSLFVPVDGGDVDAATLSKGVHLVSASDCAAVDFDAVYRSDVQMIAIAPKPVLAGSTTYGLYVTHDAAGTNGMPVSTADAFKTLRDATSAPMDPAGARAWKGVQAALACAAKAKLEPSDIAVATTFTTLRVDEILGDMHEQVSRAPAPVASLRKFIGTSALGSYLGTPMADADGVHHGWSTGGVLHDHVAAVVHGTFPSMSWTQPAPFAKGAMIYDDYANPRVRSIQPLAFTLALPAGQSLSSLPVVVWAHGILSTRAEVLAVADSFCARGFAVVGIDLPFHGERSPQAVDVVNAATGAQTSDFIGDPVGPEAAIDLFDFNGDTAHGISALDVGVMRDTEAQAAGDLMQLARLVRDGDWSAIAGADPSLASLSFDGAHVVVAGDSLGAFFVAAVAAVDDRVQFVELAVPPGGVMLPTLVDSPLYGSLAVSVVASAFDNSAEFALDDKDNLKSPDADPMHPRFDPIMALVQTVFDSADALALAPTLQRSHRLQGLVVAEAYADETVPNQASERLAAALGVPYATTAEAPPPPGPTYVTLPSTALPLTNNVTGMTAALVQLAPATHALALHRHDTRGFMPPFPPIVALPQPAPVLNAVDQVQSMFAGFAASWLSAGGGKATLDDAFAAP